MESAMRNRPRLVGSTSPSALPFALAALLLCLPSASADAAQSPGTPGMVTVTVEAELSCPSCALGLERRLNRLDHVAGVEVRPADGRIVVTVEPGRRLDLAAVRDTVRSAGFMPDGIRIIAVGHLTDVNGTPALALSPDFALPLAPGDGAAPLATEPSDRRLRMTGRWDAPPNGAGRLLVESFEEVR
jgi:copper chaperone CopZ